MLLESAKNHTNQFGHFKDASNQTMCSLFWAMLYRRLNKKINL